MKLAFAAHDAGGAEVVSSWIQYCFEQPVHAIVEGPALRIFSHKLQSRIKIYSREEFAARIQDFDAVLTGTSWASDLEKQVHRWCKMNAVHSIAFLDHWTEYRQRFTLGNSYLIPDELWVSDRYALAIAQRDFPQTGIKMERNYYLAEILDRIRSCETKYEHNTSGEKILYCTEPTSVVAAKKTGDQNAYGYTEYTALDGMLAYLQDPHLNVQEFRIRPHPSESAEKYAYLKKRSLPFLISFSLNEDLAEDCAWADTIVGCDSMVLAVAALANKKAISAIPKGGRSLSIPFKEICRLFD
jgi:hypothetical protein